MSREQGTDPRDSPENEPQDIRPIVAAPRSGLSMAAIAGLLVIAAILLFIALDQRRRANSAPAVGIRFADIGAVSVAPPPLYVPPEPRRVEPPPAPAVSAPIPPPPPAPARYIQPMQPMFASPVAPTPLRPASTEPALVIDNGGGTPPASTENAGAAPGSGTGAVVRERASIMRNRGTTVAQGTLIPAVLETALDSTRPGMARAIVSRDVRGFDGTRVLVPRGSRLIGEYRSDVSPGQKRAMVIWARLIRPDGAVISIGSPAADPLGRGGIRGSVDSHFLERFGTAILQSALDIGVNVASSRIGGSSVIVGVPNMVQNSVSQPVTGGTAPPTIKVRQGTEISVFVARDLDFTAVESRR